jgi:LysM repeat protein
MKMPTILKPKKLSASTARRSRALGLPDAMDYEEMSEPNMKLSRALLIVLVLHIVAVAGIVAFNTIKTREEMNTGSLETAAAAPASSEHEPEDAPAAAAAEKPAAVEPNEVTKVAARMETKTPEKSLEHSKSTITTPSIPDSGQIYEVKKGENPVTIARHLHVNYDALLELNQIEDPRKLQIGQKLHIPERSATSKHKSD